MLGVPVPLNLAQPCSLSGRCISMMMVQVCRNVVVTEHKQSFCVDFTGIGGSSSVLFVLIEESCYRAGLLLTSYRYE